MMIAKSRRWLLSLAVLLAALPVPTAFAVLRGEAILSGTPNYSYVVALVAGSNVICSGIAIGDRWVLTAAHCTDTAESIVPFGASQVTHISRWFCPSGYVRSTVPHLNAKNDLALLKTQDPIGGWWPRSKIAEPSSAKLVVFGWGKTSPNDVTPTLHKSQPMRRQDGRDSSGTLECEKFWKAEQVVDTNEICAGEAASSACNGDSGGPLFSIDSESEPENLVGILSKADNDCNSLGIFDIYTTIDSQWIEKIVSGDITVQSQSTCP